MGQLLSKNIPQDGAALAPSTASKPSAPELPKAESKMSTPELIAKKRRYVPRKERKLKKQKLAHRKSQMLDLFTSFLFHRYVQDMDANDIEFLETEQWQEDDALLDSLSANSELKQEVKKRYAQFEDARQSLEIFMALNKANDVEQDWDPDVAQQNTLLFWKDVLSYVVKKEYKELSQSIENLIIKLSFIQKPKNFWYTCLRVLDVAQLYFIMQSYKSDVDAAFDNLFKTTPHQTLESKLLFIFDLIYEHKACKEVFLVVDAFQCYYTGMKMFNGFYKDIEKKQVGKSARQMLRNFKRRADVNVIFKSKWHCHLILMFKTRLALRFYEHIFTVEDVEMKRDILVLKFMINPSRACYDSIKLLCQDETILVWYTEQCQLADYVHTTFKKEMEGVIFHKKENIFNLFMLVHEMDCVEIAFRAELLELIFSRVQKTFSSQMLETFCFDYLKRSPNSWQECELMSLVVQSLSRTGLKCREAAIKMLDIEVEPDPIYVKKQKHCHVVGPKTYVQHLEDSVRSLQETVQNASMCPILHKTMVDPVTLDCGHAFEEHSICTWLEKNSKCPLCQKNHFYKHGYKNQTLRALGLPVLEKKRKVFRDIRAMVEASMKEPRDLMEVFVIDLSEES